METVSFEENRVDQQIMDTEKFLSDRNDKKILEKRKKEAEEEMIKQVQITQNEPKRKRETSLKQKRTNQNAQIERLPSGFQEIADKLKKHFPKDHVFLQVKADGLCGVSCGSGHIFAQPQNGKQFRKQINKHLVSN